jgi:D-glycero-alpha-D-manno-heptose-7-phosphate kinase
MRAVATCGVRVDFCGAWTDEKPFSRAEGGAVLNLGVDPVQPTVTAEVELSADRPARFIVDSEDLQTSETFSSWAALQEYGGPLRLITCVISAHNDIEISELTLKVRTRCRVPFGSGLGQSGALSVALTAALQAVITERQDAYLIARRAFEIESARFRGGWQDHVAAAIGGLLFITSTAGEQNLTVNPVPLSGSIATALVSRLVIAYTGKPHNSAQIADAVLSHVHVSTGTWPILRQMKHLALQARNAVFSGDIDHLGRLVYRQWLLELELGGSHIAPEQSAVLIQDALSEGAAGARLTGAGGGGCVLLIAKHGRKKHLQRLLSEHLGADAILPVRLSHGVHVSVTGDRH